MRLARPESMDFISVGTLVLQVFLALLVVVSATFVKYALASRRPKGFPPGPPGIPVLGNVLQLPLNKAFLKSVPSYALPFQLFGLTSCRFNEWSETYGSIVGLKLGPQNVVLLNNFHHVRA